MESRTAGYPWSYPATTLSNHTGRIAPEWWPESNRNGGRIRVGTVDAFPSEPWPDSSGIRSTFFNYRNWNTFPLPLTPEQDCRTEDCPCVPGTRKKVETPPQAWGGLSLGSAADQVCRNTPTGVGRTLASPERPPSTRKHPHRRGEDPVLICTGLLESETPPQAWGGLRVRLLLLYRAGNTPTGVGRTDDQQGVC